MGGGDGAAAAALLPPPANRHRVFSGLRDTLGFFGFSAPPISRILFRTMALCPRTTWLEPQLVGMNTCWNEHLFEWTLVGIDTCWNEHLLESCVGRPSQGAHGASKVELQQRLIDWASASGVSVGQRLCLACFHCLPRLRHCLCLVLYHCLPRLRHCRCLAVFRCTGRRTARVPTIALSPAVSGRPRTNKRQRS